ncbi:hypothetical protein VF14_32640 [Nostoc linckia z18]|uniref:Uncharacterized protein n=3 Tax=Nostoc linckia TaxID=92942 RepID=A0A9Q6EIN5_NOSLI|nr:hypothetical protein VF02_24750 [Nostoc linckia z1]PHJ59912.1 hypothetical protein VF03_33980 [Nostoc linckia z2]PHJ65102.1 hypothetical protein VF05_21400 [Nostoc linckia z3]PHJ76876.1 hypothetical protein VF07_36465 [Nostoc linckia z6]PHJ83669.1 hypothetical protein VF06_12545 [Nostoc linckia z4]PHJ97841.1 hypothetical protein VF04_11075 [Nostoc linckia z7]PHJ97917.1 hypothetical protein VF08_27860 [Nostoc linckia z8]PHK02905.1 hypothetical protein VF09_30825 [Nostoc linckia z9]PHK1621
MAIVREDYFLLTRDCTAAAILSIFEYWANAAIALNANELEPWLGIKTVKDFEEMLLGIATDKCIRRALHKLREAGFIDIRKPLAHRKSLEYRFLITTVQSALNELFNGKNTADFDKSQRSNDRSPNGKNTVDFDKSQRSNGRLTIYKKDQDLEEIREKEISLADETIAPIVEESRRQSPPLSSPQILASLSEEKEILHEADSSSLGQIIPPPPGLEKIKKYQKLDAEGTKLKSAELRDWADLEIGQYVPIYRKSGYILTGGNDIVGEFALYVAKQNCKPRQEPTIALGFNVINKCESDPRSWQKLVVWVVQWQQSIAAAKEVNLAASIADEQERQRIHLASKKKFSL